MPELNVTARRRCLPHWTLPGSTYFLTFRLAHGTLAPAERAVVRGHISAGDGRYYHLSAAVVMPDHAHLLLAPQPGFDLPRVMQGIKGASARKLNLLRGRTGCVWQDESWDRIVRDADEFEADLTYMLNNPVKAGLVASGFQYDGWWCRPEFGRAEMPVPPEPNP